MFNALKDLVEARIGVAQQMGEFQELPGSGKPLPPDRHLLTPSDTRMANRILKNAGLVPKGVQACQELASIDAALANAVAQMSDPTGCKDSHDHVRKLRAQRLALVLALEHAGVEFAGRAAEYQADAMQKLLAGGDSGAS